MLIVIFFNNYTMKTKHKYKTFNVFIQYNIMYK